jgi:putative hydrolase of the HAD superfamily
MLEIDAVAFDLDGTLYPNYRFYTRIIFFAVREQRMLRAFRKARNTLRTAEEGDPLLGREFYEAQAFLMAREINRNAGPAEAEVMKRKIETAVYRGWEPLYKKVALFPHVIQTLSALKERGLKLGLLSDFPPERKIEFLGLSGFWDAVLCSEEVGRLKPDPKSFLAMAEKLGTLPERVLYVGNSRRYDIAGARNVGMKTALKVPFFLNFLKGGGKPADRENFAFYDYRHLFDYVIQ